MSDTRAAVNVLEGRSEQPQGDSVTQASRLFELAPDKVEVCLRLNNAGSRYELTHKLRPPTLADWAEYERNLKSTVEAPEHAPEALQFQSAALEAAVALYDSLFLEAAGYCVAGQSYGGGCGQIPSHHKEMVIRSLADVSAEPASAEKPDEQSGGEDVALFSLDPEQIAITLQAHAYGESYTDLIHQFTPPTAADRIHYSRIVSQALYVRGSRSLKTLLPARLPGLVKLYDQLICGVRGYCVRGQEVADRAAIVRHMDPLHKKAAVQELFEV